MSCKCLSVCLSAVHRLGEAIPELLKRLGDLQNYSVQMPNISENINRIRQLIEQARNTANKVHPQTV